MLKKIRTKFKSIPVIFLVSAFKIYMVSDPFNVLIHIQVIYTPLKRRIILFFYECGNRFCDLFLAFAHLLIFSFVKCLHGPSFSLILTLINRTLLI